MSDTELRLATTPRNEAVAAVLARLSSIARPRRTTDASLFLLVAVWLCRNLLFSSAIPAGTDMLGFVTRARQNASLGELVSAWSPSSLGAIRQVTMDNLLGAATLATGNAVLTVKLVIVATLFAAAYGAYGLSYEWYRSRQAAVIAGLLYMTSQASLTRWGSGELNVEVVVAAAPFVLLLWGRCLSNPTRRRVISLAFAMNVVLFVRIDMLAYVLPFMALQLAVMLLVSTGATRTLARAAMTSVGVALCTVGLAAYQLVPIAHGLKAHWLTTTTLFDPTEFAQRSIALFPSLLGFGREIGYFAFSGQETWLSHPWIPTPVYELAVALLVFGRRRADLASRPEDVVPRVVDGARHLSREGNTRARCRPYLFAINHVPGSGTSGTRTDG